jgi:hypothetical protein
VLGRDLPTTVFIAVVNNTSEKLFSGVNDTGENFLIVDTGQK